MSKPSQLTTRFLPDYSIEAMAMRKPASRIRRSTSGTAEAGRRRHEANSRFWPVSQNASFLTAGFSVIGGLDFRAPAATPRQYSSMVASLIFIKMRRKESTTLLTREGT
jgi:hypothetical protein